jgi:hypothetical protein
MSDRENEAKPVGRPWTSRPKDNPPPEGVLVEVMGNDKLGNWSGEAMRIDYKAGSTKSQMRRKWRWCDNYGVSVADYRISHWRLFDEYLQGRDDDATESK